MNHVLQWRKRRRLSVEEAAQLLDVTVDEYRRLECGGATARSRGVRALEHEAGITLRDIVRRHVSTEELLELQSEANNEHGIA